MFHVEHSKPISPDNPGSNEGKTSMANTKTEKPETATSPATSKQRKPRTPKTLTPLEAQIVESLNEQKAVERALRGIAKAVSKLSSGQALEVLNKAVASIRYSGPVAASESTGS